MTRAMAENMFGPHNAFWDFVYPIVAIALGAAATAAIYIELTTL
jgi:hypothetical protein